MGSCCRWNQYVPVLSVNHFTAMHGLFHWLGLFFTGL